MLKIGEFSKLSHLTIKALRFYEKEGLLVPKYIDKYSSYRFYETKQLLIASKIKAYRQLGLSIKDIKEIINVHNEDKIISLKIEELNKEKKSIETRLSILKSIMEDKDMKYQVIEKVIPECIVYYSETILNKYSDIMEWIPMQGQEVMALNPGLECSSPEYEFCEFLDNMYKETNIRVRHNQAVKAMGKESDNIKFKVLPQTKVLSIYHKGPYTNISDAYSFIIKYVENNGYEIIDTPRECYIDGIWNKENEEDWLTEIQVPIK